MRIRKKKNQKLDSQDAFRGRVGHLLKPELAENDDFLLRWLRARDFDLDKAEHMLKKSLEWRVKFSADTVVTHWKAPDVLKKYFAGGVSGFDKEGCPVYILPAAKIQISGLVMSAKKHDILKFGCFRLEEMCTFFKSQSEKHGKLIDKVVLIMDLEDYSMKHLLMQGTDILLSLMGQTEANYPEFLKICYIINAPMIFPIVYKTCKPFMSEDTKKKIIMLSGNYKEQLLKYIDASDLPVYYGGTKTDEDGDEKCSKIICQGGEVPTSYYLKGMKSQDSNTVTVTVARGTTKDIEFKVEHRSSTLHLCFWTESYDMKYKITNKETGNILIDSNRVDCHLVPEDEIIEIDEPGVYIFTLDNSYSWLQTKKVNYVLEIKPPTNGNDPKVIHSMPNTIEEMNINNSNNFVEPVLT